MGKRKYEFRPDKHRIDVFGKLYLTPTQRLTVLRWVLYSAILVVFSLIQDVVLCKANFFGTTTDLVSSAILLVVLSVILTLIGGLIPSRKAAKKDPVTALRTD